MTTLAEKADVAKSQTNSIVISKTTPVKADSFLTRGIKQLGQRLLPWLVPIILIAIWQIASVTGLLESRV